MDIKIRYLSKTGNTKKLALAIAEELEVPAKTIKEPVNHADVLFLGGALYLGDIHKDMKSFIEGIDNQVKTVVIFGTSSSEENATDKIRDCLKAKKLQVIDNEFNALGNFLFYQWKRPNKEDLSRVKQFAKEVIMAIK